MTAIDGLNQALRSISESVSLYTSHFALISGIALVPAVSRLFYFLGVLGSGALAGMFEVVVAVFRIALFYVAFRLVWPEGIGAAGGATGRLQFTPIPWPEILWHAVVTAVIIASLNLGAYWVGDQASAGLPRLESAIIFGLKNLFIIPYFVVHLLVVLRTLFWR